MLHKKGLFTSLYLKLFLYFQLQILEHGLEIHSQLISPDMRELHKRLVELYKRMKRGIQDSVSIRYFHVPITIRFSVFTLLLHQINGKSNVF